MSIFLQKRIVYLLIFLLFLILVFFLFRDLLNSYFESDEWVHFTYYLPLTRKPDGFLQAVFGTIHHTGALSQGLHVIPIAWGLFFIDTLLFGLDFKPYAVITLFLHATNSFFVFLLLRLYLTVTPEKSLAAKKSVNNTVIRSFWGINKSDFIAVLGGIFFALAQTPIHAVTGAAPFYGQNVLAVTFFILCVLSFKLAFMMKQKRYLYTTVLLLFLALLSKETAAVLFFLLPFMVFIEKRVFSFKLLAGTFMTAVVLFGFIRFILPQAMLGVDHLKQSIVDRSIITGQKSTNASDTRTITSTDISIHEDLGGVLLFRAITFPLRSISQLYFPRPTVQSMVGIITPIIYPQPPAPQDTYSQNVQYFLYGPGNDFMIYLLSIVILLVVIFLAGQFVLNKEMEKLRTIAIGLAIIVFATLPLVLIIFSFPRWGYDTYFDSRHYYLPTVGAAMLFPFLLIAIAEFVSKSIRPLIRFSIPSFLIVGVILFIWLQNSLSLLNENLKNTVTLTATPRKDIVYQMKQHLPALPDKVVFHIETDGQGAYGQKLPFQTSVPQMLSIIYYKESPLPDSFFNKPLFNNQAEGYQFENGRGFGYFTSKKNLSEALHTDTFSINDVYSYYYDSHGGGLTDRTQSVRKEIQNYLEESRNFADWQKYEDSTSAAKLAFLYPPDATVEEVTVASSDTKLIKSIVVTTSQIDLSLKVIQVTPAYDNSEALAVYSSFASDSNEIENVEVRRIFFDKYKFNEAQVYTSNSKLHYFVRFPDFLLIGTSHSIDEINTKKIEQLLGSATILQ